MFITYTVERSKVKVIMLTYIHVSVLLRMITQELNVASSSNVVSFWGLTG